MALQTRIPAIILVSQRKVERAVRRAEARMERGAKKRSRVDTGTMRGGWESEPLGKFEGIVMNKVSYTIYHEYGTSKMPAQPMLRPSLEEVQPQFEAEMRAAWL